MTLQARDSSHQERVYTDWLRGKAVWMAMFATVMLTSAYAMLVLTYPDSGAFGPSLRSMLVFAGWAAVQAGFVVVCLRKLRFERRQHAAALEIAQVQAAQPEKPVLTEKRYRELFENLTEMIAMLSPSGQYIYVNTAWQHYFGKDANAALTLGSFAAAFPFAVQTEAAALLERALTGEHIEQIHLRLEDTLGRVRELEASLFCLRDGNTQGAVRCIFRDVTLRNQRERRLAMQLGVSQVIQEAIHTEDALPRILAALGTHLGFDLVHLWRASADSQTLRHGTLWMAADCVFPATLARSNGSEFAPGEGLPGQVWVRGTPMWVEDIHCDPRFRRRDAVRADQLTTCWGVPVRVGNQAIAVIELFSRSKQRENVEMMATVETVCASIGQFLARTAQEKRVTELNRQKESILNNVADGILGADQHGRVTFANPAAAAMLGTTPNALIGRFVHGIVHEDATGDPSTCASHCRIRRGFLARDGAQGQDVFYRPDGTSFPVEFSVTPMVIQGSGTGTVVNFRDVSQREALDRMKDEFISTVSHELRTPLTSIRGALGLLSTGMLSELNGKAANLLRIAVNNSDRLVRLINDILDLERMQSGRAPLSFRRCELAELIEQAMEAMAPVADAAGVQLSLEAEPVVLDADADRLVQVITNLLSNAVKFSPAQSRVVVRLENAPEGVSLSVVDQGRGIPEEKLESIFDRFQQVDASDARQKGGTGLGLAICRTIVQQHCGRIWAERNAEGGASFHVLLPAMVRRESVSIEAPAGLEQGTVLICDSDLDARTMLGNSLRDHGYTVLEAETGHETVALAHQSRPDAILLGLAFPDMNGWQTLRMLKDQETTAEVPVVVLSMCPSSDAVPETGLPTLDSADGWLSKPAEDETLFRELARVMDRGAGGIHVLLVEDDEDLTRVILATFERAGISVSHASTRKAAVQLCETIRPSLLILDLMLPDGDGFEFIDWLRQTQDLRHLPLVVYSARDLEEGERRQLRLGPTEFLTKARVQPQQVETLVRTMLRRYCERKAPQSVVLDPDGYGKERRSLWHAAY